eukprot:6297282-Amphidinium_carterae.1
MITHSRTDDLTHSNVATNGPLLGIRISHLFHMEESWENIVCQLCTLVVSYNYLDKDKSMHRRVLDKANPGATNLQQPRCNKVKIVLLRAVWVRAIA